MKIYTLRSALIPLVLLLLAVTTACDDSSSEATDGELMAAPPELARGGKADGPGGLDSIEGSSLTMERRAEVALDRGLGWASFEMSRGQIVQLSFESSVDVSAFVYGPLTHRESTPPLPGRFLERGDELFIRGWRRPTTIATSAAQGGHYVLIVLGEESRRARVSVDVSCRRNCETRGELDGRLRAVLEGAGPLRLPARDELDAIPFDPGNPLNQAKVELGRMLFHDPRLATNAKLEEGRGTYSCASCHNANHGFGAGAPQGIGEGGTGGVFNEEGWSVRLIDPRYEASQIDAQPIASPTVVNGAYLGAALWNGVLGLGDVEVPGAGAIVNPNAAHKENWKPGTPPYWSHLGFSGLETQAIVGLHVHRQSILESELAGDPEVFALFEEAFDGAEIDALASTEDCYHALRRLTFPKTYFNSEEAGEVPEQVDCSGELEPSPYRSSVVSDLKVSLAIAAFERTLLPTQAPFQRWLADDSATHAMTLDELRGAAVFFDTREGNCVACHSGPALSDASFHVMGLSDLLESDRNRIHTKLFEGEQNGRGGWTGRDDERYAFKTPQLYNLAQRSFYGHGSTHRTLESIVRYMARGEKMVGFVGGDRPLAREFTPRDLSDDQLMNLVTFMSSGLLDPTLVDEVPEPGSSRCLISADAVSIQEQDCSR